LGKGLGQKGSTWNTGVESVNSPEVPADRAHERKIKKRDRKNKPRDKLRNLCPDAALIELNLKIIKSLLKLFMLINFQVIKNLYNFKMLKVHRNIIHTEKEIILPP